VYCPHQEGQPRVVAGRLDDQVVQISDVEPLVVRTDAIQISSAKTTQTDLDVK
jgi:hypothetical protein